MIKKKKKNWYSHFTIRLFSSSKLVVTRRFNCRWSIIKERFFKGEKIRISINLVATGGSSTIVIVISSKSKKKNVPRNTQHF